MFLPLWEHSLPHKEFPTEGEEFCGMEETRFVSRSQISFSCRKKNEFFSKGEEGIEEKEAIGGRFSHQHQSQVQVPV